MPPWTLGQVKQRHRLVGSAPHTASPGGACAVSSVRDALIPDLALGSSKDANWF